MAHKKKLFFSRCALYFGKFSTQTDWLTERALWLGNKTPFYHKKGERMREKFNQNTWFSSNFFSQYMKLIFTALNNITSMEMALKNPGIHIFHINKMNFLLHTALAVAVAVCTVVCASIKNTQPKFPLS